jgi:hypothetical protein
MKNENAPDALPLRLVAVGLQPFLQAALCRKRVQALLLRVAAGPRF